MRHKRLTEMEEEPRPRGVPHPPVPWTSQSMAGVWTELDHPADLLLRITGTDLNELFEHALYAFYSQVVDWDQLGNAVAQATPRALELRSGSLPEALRALLAETLYLFDSEGFVATSAAVNVWQEAALEEDGEVGDDGQGGTVRVTATLWGHEVTPRPELLLTEVKAVTYHQLAVTRRPDGAWQATVLFDV